MGENEKKKTNEHVTRRLDASMEKVGSIDQLMAEKKVFKQELQKSKLPDGTPEFTSGQIAVMVQEFYTQGLARISGDYQAKKKAETHESVPAPYHWAQDPPNSAWLTAKKKLIAGIGALLLAVAALIAKEVFTDLDFFEFWDKAKERGNVESPEEPKPKPKKRK